MKTLTLILSLTLALGAIADERERHTLPKGEAMEGSVYDLESKWSTQEGKIIELKELGGKVRVVAMGYTSCKFACPLIIADLHRIEKELKGKGLDSEHVGVSFISIDPKNDTAERMKKLETQYKMDPKRWRLLTGDEDGVLELAVALGMKYRQTTALDFAHSNIITVLAPDGSIAYQTSTIGKDITATLEAIRKSAVTVKVGKEQAK
ncbi:MAG: protein SCO1/2 [Pseudoalteromonas tetraodonis]|jgi:protein SCO1/2